MSAPAIERRMWAPIRINAKGRPDWPIYAFIRYTRRESKRAYLEDYRPEEYKLALKGIRFARVEVVEIVKPSEGERSHD